MNRPINNKSNHRSAFTLLELLAVITIISILLALILPAIGGAMRRAKIAEVSTEISQLDQALQMFKQRFGEYPPSSITIPPAGGAWDPQSRARIRAIWPEFDFSHRGGLDPSAPNPPPPGRHLSGAECLVFFLGGVQSGSVTAPVLNGFAKNPQRPWTPSTNTDGPFMEFDISRIVDVDEDTIFEYSDPLSEGAAPYLYISAAGKSLNKDNDNELRTVAPYNETLIPSYDDYDVFDDDAPIYDPNDPPVTQMNMSACYLQPGSGTDFTKYKPYKADTFQIIAPGEDGLYGPGGVYDDSTDLTGNRQGEADNITNFSGGSLN